MDSRCIEKTIDDYIARQILSCGALIVRQNDKVILEKKWGFADLATQKPVEWDSLFRMMSMTKCVTAVAVLRLMEKGKIRLDAPLSSYLPPFRNLRVVDDPRYPVGGKPKVLDLIWKFLTFRPDSVRTSAAVRETTIRDLLSHASGLEQGWVGYLRSFRYRGTDETLDQRVARYAAYPLDFQPGTSTGYSPLAGFDVLGKVLEVVTGKEAGTVYEEEVFRPLGMTESAFFPGEGQKKKLVTLYQWKNGKLRDVTGTSKDLEGATHAGTKCPCGSAGLYSTIRDYEKLARMLCNEGLHEGKAFLQKKTVELMRSEAQKNHLEPEPGYVWGLGVKIRQDPVRGKSPATAGTYGWSGAFGTHFFVSPADKMEAVWVTNRSDIGGSDSPVSKTIEALVFEMIRNQTGDE